MSIASSGIDGRAHAGTIVKHRSRGARDPSQPNSRQVHLIHVQLSYDVVQAGFQVRPGQLGENVTTCGIDLLALPEGALLNLGDQAIVRITGLRKPCEQINGFESGLLCQVLGRAGDGSAKRKGGIMAVVVGGSV